MASERSVAELPFTYQEARPKSAISMSKVFNRCHAFMLCQMLSLLQRPSVHSCHVTQVIWVSKNVYWHQKSSVGLCSITLLSFQRVCTIRILTHCMHPMKPYHCRIMKKDEAIRPACVHNTGFDTLQASSARRNQGNAIKCELYLLNCLLSCKRLICSRCTPDHCFERVCRAQRR